MEVGVAEGLREGLEQPDLRRLLRVPRSPVALVEAVSLKHLAELVPERVDLLLRKRAPVDASSHELVQGGPRRAPRQPALHGFEAVPDSHWDFVRNTQPYHETDSHIFVHANLEHDIPVAKQHSFTLIHKKFGTPLPHQSGKVMVCGHTAQKAPHLPLNLGHAINIDTDVGRGGWLTCLHVESGHYWQTNVDGETRNGELNSKTR